MSQDLYATPVAPQSADKTGFATTALAVGVVAVVFSFLPIIGVIAFVLAPIAIVFGVLGRKSSKHGQSVAGMICGIVALIVSVIWLAVFSAAVGHASTNLNTNLNQLNSYTNCINAAQTLEQQAACPAPVYTTN